MLQGLINALDETDGRVVSIAAKGLKKFKENNFEGITEKMAKEINKVLSFLIITVMIYAEKIMRSRKIIRSGTKLVWPDHFEHLLENYYII